MEASLRRAVPITALLSVLFTLLLAGGAYSQSASPTVFINEIHYDNALADADEGVEIAGPANTDLTGFTIVAYNGSGGASYGTTNLSGVIPDQQNGFGAIFFPIEPLQNGAPDGIALVDPSDVVVQFLSYEGFFTATSGPASGMTSTDIGVSEDGNTAVGTSLQLKGTGTTYDDFAWEGPIPQTRNAVNTNQTFGSNTAPVADAQMVQATEDTDETITLTASDADGDDLAFGIVPSSGPTNGTLSPIGPVTCTDAAPKECSAEVTYTPGGNFNGEDSFEFVANDGIADSAEAAMSINVAPANDAPVANGDDAGTTDEDTAIESIDVTANDEDIDDDALSVSDFDVTSAEGGTVTENPDGTLRYEPEENFNGPDSFGYTVSDGNGGADTATVSVTVNAVNDAPVVTLAGGPETSAVDEGDAEYAYNFAVTDDSGDDFTVKDGFPDCGTGGVLVENSSSTTAIGGSFRCAFPDGPANPNVRMQVNDGDADSNVATREVTVDNVAPKVELGGPSPVEESATAERTYTFTVADPGADTFDVEEGFPKCGNNGALVENSLATNDRGGSFACIFPDGPATSDVAIKVEDSDGATDTDNRVVQVTVDNAAPRVSALADQSSDEGENTDFDLGSFTDPGADGPWQVGVDWGDGSEGTAFEAASPGSLGQKPHAYAGDGTYTVTVTVTEEGENVPAGTASFQITVNNIAPVAREQSVETVENTPKEITLEAADAGDDSLTYTILRGPERGSLSGEGPARVYTPERDYNGSDAFVFEACDDGDPALCDEARVEISVRAPSCEEPGSANVISGTSRNDTLRGTPGDDALYGGPGNDTLSGRGGEDVLCGESGDDVAIDGGAGDDHVNGGSGGDTLKGGAGADTLVGAGGNDRLDTKDGVRGNDSADGGDGNDRCRADSGDLVRSCNP